MMSEVFTPRTQKIIQDAASKATSANGMITSQRLVLSILEDGTSVAAVILAELGVTTEKFREKSPENEWGA